MLLFYRKTSDIMGWVVKRSKRMMKSFTQGTESILVHVVEMGELTSCPPQRWARERVRGGACCIFRPYPQCTADIWTAKRQEVWPKLDNSGGGYFWKQELSVHFPVGCFVRCGCMNVSLFVKSEQFALSTCHAESVTKKPPHKLRGDYLVYDQDRLFSNLTDH